MKAAAGAARQRERVEELLVLVVVVEDRDVELTAPVPQVRLQSDLDRVELFRSREVRLSREVERLSVERSTAVTLAEIHVGQNDVAGLPVGARLEADIGVVLIQIEGRPLGRQCRLVAGESRRQGAYRLRPEGRRTVRREAHGSGRQRPTFERVEVLDGHIVLGETRTRTQCDRRCHGESGIQENGLADLDLIETVVLVEAIERRAIRQKEETQWI